MKVILAALAERVIVDERTDKFSLIDIIDGLVMDAYPLFIPDWNLVTIFENDKGAPQDIDLNMRMFLESKQIAEATFQVSFDGRPRARVFTTLSQIFIPSPGMVCLRYFVNGKKIHTLDIPALSKDPEIHPEDEIGRFKRLAKSQGPNDPLPRRRPK